MEITEDLKHQVVLALLADMDARGSKSQTEYANYISNLLGIPFNKAAFSQVKSGKNMNAIKDSSWLVLARHFNLLTDKATRMQIVPTYVFKKIQERLLLCKESGIWEICCDRADIGKTTAAKDFAKQHKDSVFYVDCSDFSGKNDFVLAVASLLGLTKRGTYSQLWREVANTFLLIREPQLILDEFGDVHDSVITLLKNLYNKTDMGDHVALSVYHIGASNLRNKLENGRKKFKPSYEEYWSRTNSETVSILPQNISAAYDIINRDIDMINTANIPANLTAIERSVIVDECKKTRGVRATKKAAFKARKISSYRGVEK